MLQLRSGMEMFAWALITLAIVFAALGILLLVRPLILKKMSPSDWIAAASMMVAFVAVILALYEGGQNRLHNRLSVKPKILISFHHNEEGAGYILSNSGLGPAIIKWIEVKVDGAVQANWGTVAEKLFSKPIVSGFHFVNPTAGTSFANGSNFKIFWFKAEDPRSNVMLQAYKRVQIDVCYCSMYEDDCLYFSTSKKNKPHSNFADFVPEYFFGFDPPIKTIEFANE